jgi:hypothetical protein
MDEELRQKEAFKKMMLEKFIEAERIEQMNATKRRRKLLEHRREVKLTFLFKFNRLRNFGS